MSEKTTVIFTCNGCGAEQEGQQHTLAPIDWRALHWRSGYMDDSEKREAHFCGKCHPRVLRALDVILTTRPF